MSFSNGSTYTFTNLTDSYTYKRPALATTRGGQGAWQVVPTQMPPILYKASVGGDFHNDTLFNPTWGDPWWLRPDTLLHVKNPARQPNERVNTFRPVPRSPPQLIYDEGSTESTSSRSPSDARPDVSSPPQTGCSVTAVLGSAGVHKNYAFRDDYDRPEASPNFVRKALHRSKSCRRQMRMRNGDFRTTDDEEDYHVGEQPVIIPEPEHPTRRTPLVSSAPIAVEARVSTTPSRLSQRVRAPPPLNTAVIRMAIAKRVLSQGSEYDLEVGDLDGTPLSGSEAGFDGDDEEDEMQQRRFGAEVGAIKDRHSTVRGGQKRGELTVSVTFSPSTTPEERPFAAVVARLPRADIADKEVSRTVQTKHDRKGTCFLGGYVWQPFNEPLD